MATNVADKVSTSAGKLKKELGLFDVYAICTGAMFSSGFFLLPGLAAAQTGPSVALAYLIAGILMLPENPVTLNWGELAPSEHMAAVEIARRTVSSYNRPSSLELEDAIADIKPRG